MQKHKKTLKIKTSPNHVYAYRGWSYTIIKYNPM